MENLTDQEICLNLKRLYNETESSVKANAIVSRAYMEKSSMPMATYMKVALKKILFMETASITIPMVVSLRAFG